jgi:hypothetical protein
MTRDILQSDIELARKLLEDACPDNQIIETLLRRGIPEAQASHLVEDLRHGKLVMAKPPSVKPPALVLPNPALERGGSFRRRRSHQPHRSRPTRRAERNVILALALVCLLVIAAVVLWYRPHRTASPATGSAVSKSVK